MNTQKTMQDIINQIAMEHLDLETLDTQKSGDDFKEVAVWNIKSALEAAFKAGLKNKA